MTELMNQAESIAISNITILGIAGVTLTFLIKYFIASKDKNTEVIMKDIKEIKDSFNKLANDNTLINSHLGYSKSNQDGLMIEVTKIRDKQGEQSRVLERLTSFKTNTERQLSELEKKFNTLKK